MSKFLLIFSSDWADEFQAESFTVYDSKATAFATRDAYIAEGGYFGTNEGFEDGELSERDFQIVEISDELAGQVIGLFGRSFGTGLS